MKALFSITISFVNPPRIRRSVERHPPREVQHYSCAKVLPLTVGAGHHQWPDLGWHSDHLHARTGAPTRPARIQKFQQVTVLQVDQQVMNNIKMAAKFIEAQLRIFVFVSLYTFLLTATTVNSSGNFIYLLFMSRLDHIYSNSWSQKTVSLMLIVFDVQIWHSPALIYYMHTNAEWAKHSLSFI